MTAGGVVFVATASDRTVRAYDRDNGKVVWSANLPTGSEGVPATYEVNGRQFVVFPVAAGTGGFSIRFGGPPPAAAPTLRAAWRSSTTSAGSRSASTAASCFASRARSTTSTIGQQLTLGVAAARRASPNASR